MKYIIVLAFTCCSCSKTTSLINKNGLAGTWQLVQISGGFAGGTRSPDKPASLTFEASKNFSATFNNQPADKGIYAIIKAGQPNYYYSDTLLKLFSANGIDTLTYGLRVIKDSLFLDEGCCDRFNYTYARLN